MATTKSRIAVITSCFNSNITERLKESCIAEILTHSDSEVVNFMCPGAVELVQVANCIKKRDKYDAIVLIGAVIKGDTDHYEYICSLVVQAVANLIMNSNIPIVFGVLTVQSEDQAEERADPARMNKGKEFGECAMQMITTFREVEAGSKSSSSDPRVLQNYGLLLKSN